MLDTIITRHLETLHKKVKTDKICNAYFIRIHYLLFFCRKCGQEINEDIKIQKHKVIAQTWAKRKEFQDKGRLSISFYNTHTDPVGLNFNVNDLNSTGTNDISSTWANYLPHFVKRRFALTGATTNSSSCGPRKSSLDSNKISISVKRVSVESISRRNSVDSQVSLKISEMQTKVARRTHGTVKGKGRNRRRDFTSHGRGFSRRESSTSVESQVITAVKKTNYPSNKIGLFSTKENCMKRRSASAGIVDADDINNLLTNGELILPFLHNQGMTTTSDDDNISRTSFKVQDSRLNVVVRGGISDDDIDNIFKGENYEQKYIQTNEYSTDNILYPSVQEILNKTAIVNSSENTLKNSKDRLESRNSKNSLKSIRSRKSSRQSMRKNRKNSKNMSKQSKKDVSENFSAVDDSSFASFSSGLEIPTGIQSSYSGVSACKTHSRNSKTSCDVGIQTNAHEIATQTMSFEDIDSTNVANTAASTTRNDTSRYGGGMANTSDNKSSIAILGKHSNDDDDIYSENHQLLPSTKKREPSIVSRRDAMSESEKLKLLLLPSK